ncbi:MAG: nucleoside triphosphate pyrophosphohydrolase [Clostridiaceae bacterium]|nr:nucleoside triphosphate pyrophosphohydrolase [Clostridiaceae bacterium]
MPQDWQSGLPAAEDFQNKEHYTMEELLTIMAFLRSDRGCPWDRAQTHDSIRKNLLEEAYETIDAIESGKPERICDELGDVLMQVVFHAQMAREAGSFAFSDVVDGICRKLISRHTHIFGQDHASTPDEVIDNWEKNKRQEKGLRSQSQVLTDVPRSLPALQRSYKIQQKAAQVGFDWDDAAGPRQKIDEELGEIEECVQKCRHAVDDGTMTSEEAGHLIADETGDLLFAAVNYARHLHVQPEMALNRANEKFIRRFAAVEQLAKKRSLDLEVMSLTEMDRLWDEVKQQERSGGDDAT